jgi:type II secretory pathway pseudopilin PulG
MRSRQSGLSLVTLIVALFVIALVAIFGMKVVPSFMEFRAAKKAIDAIAQQKQGASAQDIRRAFEDRSTIDDISSVNAKDLEITKDGNAVVISFAYRKEVPLFKNVGLYIDYNARSGD